MGRGLSPSLSLSLSLWLSNSHSHWRLDGTISVGVVLHRLNEEASERDRARQTRRVRGGDHPTIICPRQLDGWKEGRKEGRHIEDSRRDFSDSLGSDPISPHAGTPKPTAESNEASSAVNDDPYGSTFLNMIVDAWRLASLFPIFNQEGHHCTPGFGYKVHGFVLVKLTI